MTAWREEPNALVRELAFKDYDEARAFVDYLAEYVEDYQRHPDVAITVNRVRIEIGNLHHAGVTLAERRLASKVDAALAEHHPHMA